MTDASRGGGRRVLLVEPAARAARDEAEGRLARLLVVGALASFLGFFGLAVVATPPSGTAPAGQPALTTSAPFVVRGDDDDDDGGWFSTRSEVRTRTS